MGRADPLISRPRACSGIAQSTVRALTRNTPSSARAEMAIVWNREMGFGRSDAPVPGLRRTQSSSGSATKGR